MGSVPLFKNPYIVVKSVDRFTVTAERAAEITRQHGIKPPDAIHVATAIRWQCECLQTIDGLEGGRKKLLTFDGKVEVPSLKIEVPNPPPASALI